MIIYDLLQMVTSAFKRNVLTMIVMVLLILPWPGSATQKPDLEIGEVVIEASAPILTGGHKDPITILETQASTSFVSDTVRRQAIGAPDLIPPPDQPAMASGGGCLAPFLGLGGTTRGRMIKAAKAWEQMRWQEVIKQLTPVALNKDEIIEKTEAFYFIARSKHYLGDISGAANAYEMLRNNYPEHPYCEHALYALGWIYLESENTPQAMQVLDQLATQFPASTLAPYIRYLKAAIYNKDGDYQSALENLEGIIAGYPMFPQMEDVQFWSAENQFYLKKFDSAHGNYSLYLQNYSEGDKRVEAYYGRAFCQIEMKNHQEALNDFKTIIEMAPETRLSADSAFQAGKLAVYLDDKHQALKFFQKAVGLINNETPRKNEALAWIQYQQENYEKAAAMFEETAGSYPVKTVTGELNKRHAELVFLAALSCFKAEKYASAADKFDNLSMVASGDLKLAALANAGVSWLKLRRLDDAQLRLQEALEGDGQLRGRSLYMLYSAEVLFRLKQYDASIATFEKLRKENNAEYEAEIIRGIAWNCYALKQWGQAAEYFGELAEKFKESALHAEALLRRAESLFNNGEYTRAKAGFIMLISQYPLHPEAFEARMLNARADWIRGDTEMGLNGLKDALRYAPSDVARQKVRLTIGDLLLEQGDFQAALDEFRQAYQEAPEADRAIEAQLKRADCLYNLSKYTESADVYRQIIRDYPDAEQAGNAQYSIGLIYFRQNRLDEYLQECLRTVQSHPGTRQGALALEGAVAILSERDRLVEAIELQQQLLMDYRGFIDQELVRFRLAQNLIKVQQDSQAESELEKILQTSKSGRYAADATMELAMISLNRSDEQGAILKYESVIENFPYHPRRVEAISKLAEIRTGRREWAEAITLWSIIIDDNSDSHLVRTAHSELAEIYLMQGVDLAMAMNHAEKVAETTDRKMISYSQLLLAKITEKQGDTEASLKQYMKVTYLYPEQTEIVIESLIRAAALLKQQDKLAQYKRVMEKAVQKADTAQRLELLNEVKRDTGLAGGTE